MAERLPVGRIGAFFLLPLLSAVLPFVALPVVARRASLHEWAALGAGQSIGMVTALIIAWGWAIVGPVQVARLDRADSRRLYASSITMRCSIALIATPFSVTVSWWLSGGEPLAPLMTLATAVSGLAPTWYNIGLARPMAIFWSDLLPRAIATAVSVVCILAGFTVLIYPALLFVGAAAGVAIYSVREIARIGDLLISPRQIGRAIGAQSHVAATELSAAAYALLCAPIVLLLSGIGAAALFVSAERFYRIGLTGISSLTNGMQKWVAEEFDNEVARTRRRNGAVLLMVAGGCGAVIFGLALPPVSVLFFGQHLSVDQLTAVALGLSFFFVSINTALGRFYLVPLGRTHQLFRSTLIGAMIGFPAILVLTAAFGAQGAALGLSLSQLSVCAAQVVFLRRASS